MIFFFLCIINVCPDCLQLQIRFLSSMTQTENPSYCEAGQQPIFQIRLVHTTRHTAASNLTYWLYFLFFSLICLHYIYCLCYFCIYHKSITSLIMIWGLRCQYIAQYCTVSWGTVAPCESTRCHLFLTQTHTDS